MHLVIRGAKGKELIPQTIQLIVGRTGQDYNQRKSRTSKSQVLSRSCILFRYARICKGKIGGCGDRNDTNLHWPSTARGARSMALHGDDGISCIPKDFGHLSGCAVDIGVG